MWWGNEDEESHDIRTYITIMKIGLNNEKENANMKISERNGV